MRGDKIKFVDTDHMLIIFCNIKNEAEKAIVDIH